MPGKNSFLILILLFPFFGFSQVTKFMGRFDVSTVSRVNDSTWNLTGNFVDETGSYTGLNASIGDRIIQRGYDSLGRIVYDRYKIKTISSQTVTDLSVNIVSDFHAGVQNSSKAPLTGSFPIASSYLTTSSLTYRTSFYNNYVDPDYDAALDNLNINEIQRNTPIVNGEIRADSANIPLIKTSVIIAPGNELSIGGADGENQINIDPSSGSVLYSHAGTGVGYFANTLYTGVGYSAGIVMSFSRGYSTSQYSFEPTSLTVPGVVNATGGNSTNWNTVYNWAVVQITANANSVIGDVVYINSSGKAQFCKSDTISNSRYAFAICLDATIAANASGNWLTKGSITNSVWNWTVGGLVYVSTSGYSGATLTQSPPAGANNVVMPVGVAMSATTMYFLGNINSVEHQ